MKSFAPTKRSRKRATGRNRRGSLLVVIMLTLIGVAIFFLGVIDLSVGLTKANRKHYEVEAAALAAAQELSRLVIEDPYFGYIGLGDLAPTGSLAAQDGEPLPVSSINTLMSAARNRLVIASELDNPTLVKLSLQDLKQAKRAARDLETALTEALKPSQKGKLKDRNGESIDVYGAAAKVLSQEVQNSFTLELGYLEGSGSTVSQAPKNFALAKINPNELDKGIYRPDKNYAYLNENIYFAAVGRQCALVPSQNFRRIDGNHIASIVRVTSKARIGLIAREELSGQVKLSACAQPQALGQKTIPGSFLLDLPQGKINGINTLAALLHSQVATSREVPFMIPRNGDFPSNGAKSRISDSTESLPSQNSQTETLSAPLSELIATAFHDWLRTGADNLDIDSVLQAVRCQEFQPSLFALSSPDSARFVRFDLDNQGTVRVNRTATCPFNSTRVHENQLYCFASASLKSAGGLCSISLTDQVNKLGRLNGGRHGGQPIAPETINWTDLARYSESGFAAPIAGRGKELGLLVEGKESLLADGGISCQTATFLNKSRAAIDQPRSTHYSGGLAVAVQLFPDAPELAD